MVEEKYSGMKMLRTFGYNGRFLKEMVNIWNYSHSCRCFLNNF